MDHLKIILCLHGTLPISHGLEIGGGGGGGGGK